MKIVALFGCIIALSLGGCSGLPSAGPMASEVAAQGQTGNEVLFDVVPVDEAYLAFGLLRTRKQDAEILIQDAGHGCCFPGTENPNPIKLWEARAAMTKHFVSHLCDPQIRN